MARYIDADKLIEAIRKYADVKHSNGEQIEYVNGILKSISVINEQPTADVVEVKHGEWIGEYEETCSECGRSISEILDDGSYYSTEFNIKEFIACPYCGAKMDGGKDINVPTKLKNDFIEHNSLCETETYEKR